MRKLADKVCPQCGNTFRPPNRYYVYCGNECRLIALHARRREAGQFFNVRCWTEQEDQILRDCWPDPSTTLQDLASKLSGRTSRAVGHRLHALRIRKSRRGLFGKRNPFYGKRLSEETRKKIADSVSKVSSFRNLAKCPEFQRKRRAALYAKPNKAETALDSIIQDACPEQFDFVGDGKFIIDGLNPDWVHRSKKIVIELFGRSFHDPAVCAWDVPHRSTVSGRTAVLKKFGYDVLIIWDDELKIKNKASKIPGRIRKFMEDK